MSSVSDSDILTALRRAMVEIATGGMASYTTPGGMTVTRHNLRDLQAMIDEYEARIATAARGGRYRAVELGEVGL